MPKEKISLKYDLYALSMIEDYSGSSAITMIQELEKIETSKKVTAFKSLKILVWAGLLHSNENISMKEACLKMDGLSLVEISKLVGEAVEASELFEKEAETPVNPPKP